MENENTTQKQDKKEKKLNEYAMLQVAASHD
jgi:hypothetical protein